MSERTFPEVSIPYGDKSTRAMKITCAECEGVAYFPFLTGINRKPPIAAIQHFQAKGWVVGSSHRKDACPIHVRPRKSTKGGKPMTTDTQPAADAPREMSREDRRIVFDKISGVYDTDRYIAPWTDAAVAKDLGVPRDWVATVRADFFGEAGSNQLFDEYLAKKAEIEAELRTIRDHFADEKAALGKMSVEAVGALTKTFQDFEKRVAELTALGRKIEREIGK